LVARKLNDRLRPECGPKGRYPNEHPLEKKRLCEEKKECHKVVTPVGEAPEKR